MRKIFGNSMYLYGFRFLVFFSKMTVLNEKKSFIIVIIIIIIIMTLFIEEAQLDTSSLPWGPFSIQKIKMH